MATTTMKKAIRYIDDTHAQVTKAFEKKSCIFGTDEFQEWRAYKSMFPKAQMVTKTIKKSETQKKRRNRTYENMEEYINTLADEAIRKVSFRGRVSHPITPSASRGLDFPKYTPTPPMLHSWTSAGMYSIKSPG